jgi:hypothetical protein
MMIAQKTRLIHWPEQRYIAVARHLRQLLHELE